LLAGCSGGQVNAPFTSIPSQSIGRQAVHPTLSQSRGELFAKTLLVKPGINALLTHATPSLSPAAAFGGAVFVSDSGANEVYRVTAGGKITRVGSGWSEPQGIAVDPGTGDVNVADTNNARIVVLSKTGKPVTVLNDPGQYPAGVAVAPNGTVGVTNILSQSDGPGSVSMYPAGATSPSCTTSGVLASAYFIGADSRDNFYADGIDASTGASIVALVSTTCAITPLEIAPNLVFPGGVQVIESGRGKKAREELLVGDQDGLAIYPYDLATLQPLATVPLGGGIDEVEFALTKNKKVVGSSDAGTAEVELWPWPAGGSSPAATITGFSLPVGIGFVPSGDE